MNKRGVLVTGSAKRVGRAIAEALGADGWFVCIHHRASPREADEVVEGIVARGGRAAVLQADLGNSSETEDLIGRATELTGGLTCLVNNASPFDYDNLRTLTVASLDRHISANLSAPALLCRDFARALSEEEEGCIVNMLDQKLWNLNPDFLSYTVSKVGLHGLTEVLAMALAPRIRVCGIAPGLLLPSAKMTPEGFARAHRRTPLGFGPTVDEIVAAVRFVLATPGLTGQHLIIDGGESLRRRPQDVQFDAA